MTRYHGYKICDRLTLIVKYLLRKLLQMTLHSSRKENNGMQISSFISLIIEHAGIANFHNPLLINVP